MARNIQNNGGVVSNIYVNFGENKEIKPYLKDFYWWDNKIKKSYTFKCSSLRFNREWNKDIQDYINVPIPVTDTVSVNSANKESLKKSINKYLNYNSSELEIIAQSDKGLVVQIPNEELEDFKDYLTREGFKFNIE